MTWARGSAEAARLQLSGQAQDLFFPVPSPQGSQLLAATYNKAAQLWKVGEAQSKVRPDCGGSLGERGHASGGGVGDRVLAMPLTLPWDAQETLSGHADKVTAAKFKLTRHQAVTGSRDRTVKEWDLCRAYCEAQPSPSPLTRTLAGRAMGGCNLISGRGSKTYRHLG